MAKRSNGPDGEYSKSILSRSKLIATLSVFRESSFRRVKNATKATSARVIGRIFLNDRTEGHTLLAS
jgi:hypothetical protein